MVLGKYGLISAGVLAGQVILLALASVVYKRVRKATRAPDQVVTAGAWARDWLDERGLDGAIRVVASERTGLGDTFWPTHGLVHLTEETFFDRSTSSWAVAAHEIGHALVKRWLPPVGWLLQACRLGTFLAGLAGTMMVANLWLASPEVTAAAWWILAVGLTTQVGVLLDEAAASTIALGILAQEPAVDARRHGRATAHLLAAFGTYLAAFVGAAILLAKWDLVAALVDAQVAPTLVPLAGTAALAAKALAVIVLLMILVRLVWVVFFPARETAPLVGCTGFLQMVPSAPLLALTWRMAPGKLLALAVALAATPLVELALGAVAIPLAIVLIVGLATLDTEGVLLRWLTGKAPEEEDGPEVDTHELEAGTAAMAEMMEDLKTHPPLMTRLHGMRHSLLWVPLCVLVLLA